MKKILLCLMLVFFPLKAHDLIYWHAFPFYDAAYAFLQSQIHSLWERDDIQSHEKQAMERAMVDAFNDAWRRDPVYPPWPFTEDDYYD